jgi:hypothetical protein
MQLLAIFALILAFMLGLFAFMFFVKASTASDISVRERFGVTFVLLCIAAAIAYGSLSVLVGGAA